MIAGVALGLMVVGLPTAVLAGEITGNGKPTPIRRTANSEGPFSGQSDGDDATKTQSWGRIPKAERDFLTSIGVAGNRLQRPTQPANGDATPEP
jgi:hypothetical protein